MIEERENDEFNRHERQTEIGLGSRKQFEDENDNLSCRERLRGTEYLQFCFCNFCKFENLQFLLN